jgi:hypothetical protein
MQSEGGMMNREQIDLDALEQKALAATQGIWDIDTVKNEGDYGSGPDDCRTGFMSFSVHDKNGNVLFDSLNRDTGISEIQEEYSEDHIYAWDEKAKRDFEFIVSANPALILELIRRLREAERDAKRYNWIKQQSCVQDAIDFECNANSETLDDYDKAIDLAMSKESDQ